MTSKNHGSRKKRGRPRAPQKLATSAKTTKGDASGSPRVSTPAGSDRNLILPAIQAQMGDWIYYITSMRLSDVAARVQLAEELHEAKSLSEYIQRRVTKRSEEIAKYLEEHEERFFNSLVIGVYGGMPQFFAVDIKPNPHLDPEKLPDTVEGALGILTLGGAEDLYALDGQHRVEGIRRAVRRDASLGADVVSCVFVAFLKDTALGMRRTRRLFTTLNRYAKPITPRDAVALDEDDVSAIVTRRLIEQYELFKDPKVSIAGTKALAATNTKHFTTLVGLYDATDDLLKPSSSRPRQWSQFKKRRPSDTDLNTNLEVAKAFWDQVRTNFPPVEAMAVAVDGDGTVAQYRHRDGGHLLFRPMGLRILVRAYRALLASGIAPQDALAKLAAVPMELGSAPWVGLLFDPQNHRVLYTGENQNAATRLLVYAAGGSLEKLKTTPEKLRDELAGLLGREPEDVQLPLY